jgi:hypothetical protein
VNDRLTKCKDCDQLVSKRAATCPNCGVANPGETPSEPEKSEPVKKPDPTVGEMLGTLLFIGLLIGIIIFLFRSCASDEPAETKPNVVDDASRLCTSLRNTGLVTECSVSGWGSTVDVTIDTTGSEARKMCSGIVDSLASHTSRFRDAARQGNEWKLQIFSPYSGERPIAVCEI